jgi:hypothetical protein
LIDEDVEKVFGRGTGGVEGGSEGEGEVRGEGGRGRETAGAEGKEGAGGLLR